MKRGLSKQQKESLDNKIVFASSAMFLYAMLLMFVQKMSNDIITISGAQAFIDILRWVSLAGAMACAAWSAYKEKKSFFIYCAMCLFIFLSTTVIKFCTELGSNSAYIIVYTSLAVMFVLLQIFYALKVRNMFEKKAVRIVFTVVCIAALAGFAAISVLNINSVMLPVFMQKFQASLLSFIRK